MGWGTADVICCLTGALQACIVGKPKPGWEGGSGLQPQLGLLLSRISAVFVIFPVTAVLALKPELYTCWAKVLTFYVRSERGRATTLFVLSGTMI